MGFERMTVRAIVSKLVSEISHNEIIVLSYFENGGRSSPMS